MRRVLPKKTVAFSAYYAAAERSHLRDYGTARLGPEEQFFNEQTRSLVLARFRREVRNNPFLSALYRKFPESMGASRLRSASSSKDYNEGKDLFWKRYAKNCTSDGYSLAETERLLWGESLVAGELFTILHANGKIQPIASEFCGSPFGQTDRRPDERNGIIYRNGRPIAYRFGTEDRNGFIDYSEKNSTVVPARFVNHWYRRDRVAMGRGLPWLLAALDPARDLYEIATAKTKQIKDANKLSGVIETQYPDNFLPSLSSPVDSDGAALTETGASPADAQQNTDAADEQVVEFKDGTLISLAPGEKVNMLMTQYHAEDYRELVFIMLHTISASIGLPTELWFSGIGEVNYSGFKGLGSQWGGTRRDYHALEEERFLNPLHFWRQSKAVKEGDQPKHPDADEDRIQWAHTRAAVLDEERESKANATKLESGESGLEDIWRDKGLTAAEVFAQRRQTYIRALQATGDMSDSVNPESVAVPLEFLLFNTLPGMQRAGTNRNSTDETRTQN